MRKKHDHQALLKYMQMLEDGYSINYIHTRYGIDHSRLEKLWLLYQKEGVKVLCRQKYTRSDATFRYKVVLDIEKNGISLTQASIKYGVSTSRLVVWLRTYRTGGFEALSKNEADYQVWEDQRKYKSRKLNLSVSAGRFKN